MGAICKEDIPAKNQIPTMLPKRFTEYAVMGFSAALR
jgi:hypothetical protein